MKKIGCILLMSLFILSASAQKESSDVRSGNRLYKSSKFTDAEVAYRKGLLLNPKSFEANYNLGNALFKQKKYTEALEKYNNAVALQPADKQKLAATFHNVGNSLLADKKIEESIKAYKMALKNNPKDDETRYNLAYAQMLLKKQQQDKDKNKDKDKDKQDQKQNQPKQEQPKQEQQQQQQQQPKPQMSKENAQQILDALMQDEKNTQDKAKKQQVRGAKKAEKDW
ncbi:MAG: tetratricopeptide repeat protein [Paludibacter sp.]